MMGGYRERGGLRDDFTEGGEVARLLLEHRTEVSFSIKRERYPPSWKDVIFGDLCVQSLLCCDGSPDSASSQCLPPLSSSNIHSPDQDCVFKYSFRTRSYDPGHPKSLPNKNPKSFRSSWNSFWPWVYLPDHDIYLPKVLIYCTHAPRWVFFIPEIYS